MKMINPERMIRNPQKAIDQRWLIFFLPGGRNIRGNPISNEEGYAISFRMTIPACRKSPGAVHSRWME